MASIRDVAKSAGVSIATVSRVLNDSDKVQEKTKQNVRKAMLELSYNPPRSVMKSSKKNPRRNIMVLVPDISNPFYATAIKGINEYAIDIGYNVLLCNTNYDRRIELEHLKIFKTQTISGMIFFGSTLTRDELLELNKATHIIQCGEYLGDAKIPHISIDNSEAMRSGMNHLLSLNHREIALISCENNFASAKLREKCYMDIMEEVGCGFNPNFLIRCASYEFKSGMRAMMQLLQRKKKPTAVFAMSDLLAIGAMQAALQSGLRIPEDIAVVGFDDIEYASMCSPSLTTIAQPSYDIGYIAAKMLYQKITGEEIQSAYLFLEHELKIRQSTLGNNRLYPHQER